MNVKEVVTEEQLDEVLPVLRNYERSFQKRKQAFYFEK